MPFPPEVNQFKLVRDRFAPLSTTQRAQGEQLIKALKVKLSEELYKFLDNPSEESMADMYEVMDCLTDRLKFSGLRIQQVKERKGNFEGGYELGLMIKK